VFASIDIVLSVFFSSSSRLVALKTTVDEKASLADIIRALMDYNDQQNANLGVGYNDPDDDDSFIDDSTAAQDIIPKNMTNERDGFYVNEKHQPIKARYLSTSSESESEISGDDTGDDTDDNQSSDNDEQLSTMNTTVLMTYVCVQSHDIDHLFDILRLVRQTMIRRSANSIELLDNNTFDRLFQDVKKRKIDDESSTLNVNTIKRKR
jgi:hypothetical protein